MLYTALADLVARGLDVRFTRTVNQRPRCEIYLWDGTLLAHAAAATPWIALRDAVEGLDFLDLPAPAPRPPAAPRRLYAELRKRGIEP